jgi:hypothetical protein
LSVADRPDLAAALHRLHLAAVEPLLIAARKRRRLAAFGIERLADIPCAAIAPRPDAAACPSLCAARIAAERRYYRRYLSARTGAPIAPSWHGVPAIIALDRYPDFSSYADRVRRHSKGGVLRQVRKARAAGFYCKTIYGDFYRRQRFAIEASKRFRSGLVLASLLRRPPPSDFPPGIGAAETGAYLGVPPSQIVDGMALPEPPSPACPWHWGIEWGVFTAAEKRAAADEVLVGYLALRRTGNLVRTTALMGHGAYLSQHVMKLLFHEVMRWLLARADPQVRGLSYLLYGAIEHGNDGLFAWKRSFEFQPLRLAWGGDRGEPERH